jgi:FAD/FMN-containing dehydrogenase/Fe-S oxidoreductase
MAIAETKTGGGEAPRTGGGEDEARRLAFPAQKLSELERRLAGRIKGEVRFDRDAIGSYAYDGSIYRQLPLGVVIPKDAADVEAALEECRRMRAPVLPRGCGTSLAGQCCNFAVVFDFSKYMNNILELDPKRQIARVQPGVICDTLRNAAEKHQLTFAPDPATHDHCTLGGMIGNNSCGTHSVMGGKTVDNVIELDVLLYDGTRLKVGQTSPEELDKLSRESGRRGEIYRRLREIRDRYGELVREKFPDIPRRVSGYNLDSLLPEKDFHLAQALVGSEGTCVLVLEATVRLVPSPPKRALVVVGYPDVPSAGYAAAAIMEYQPIGLEHFNHAITDGLHKKGKRLAGEGLLPKGGAWLLVEFGGQEQEEADRKARKLLADLEGREGVLGTKLYDSKEEESEVWEIRRNSVGASRIPPFEHGGWPNWEDAAVPVPRLGDYLTDYIKLCEKHGYHPTFYGHFGQGCVHCRMDWRLRERQSIDNFMRFMDEASDLVVSYGGSLSGEHGDGHGRAPFWPKMFGHELVRGMREFKQVWDPQARMNPGKLVNPYRVDQHLREGVDYNPVPVKTYFQYPEDAGSFAEAAGRCFGVGKCRHLGGGTMCPSFMVTREEINSTRGRARLLNEMMLNPEKPDNPWRDEAVKEALDLCLACKGCKHDCPVSVDMATYKAEFLAHYYKGRLKPAPAYLMGLIMKWAPLASRFPRLVNLATHFPVVSGYGKAMVGLAPERPAPSFAPTTFQAWFERRGGARNPTGPPVLLWPDTFNNYFHPETAMAAAEVLEAGGYRVIVPRGHLCCGRPLFDYGMVERAQGMLADAVAELLPLLRDGIEMVAVEPSCAASFRDELTNLFPHDEDARKLSKQTKSLSEFVLAHEDRFAEHSTLSGKAILHAHCHQKALWGDTADKELLGKLGLEVEAPDSGCCGLAGSFGYEKGDKFEVSVKAGERVLAPAVRNASDQTLIVADGFSCRSQVGYLTERQPLHVAEVMHMAMAGEQVMKDGRARPEKQYRQRAGRVPGAPFPRTAAAAAAGAGALLVAGLVLRRAAARR